MMLGQRKGWKITPSAILWSSTVWSHRRHSSADRKVCLSTLFAGRCSWAYRKEIVSAVHNPWFNSLWSRWAMTMLKLLSECTPFLKIPPLPSFLLSIVPLFLSTNCNCCVRFTSTSFTAVLQKALCRCWRDSTLLTKYLSFILPSMVRLRGVLSRYNYAQPTYAEGLKSDWVVVILEVHPIAQSKPSNALFSVERLWHHYSRR